MPAWPMLANSVASTRLVTVCTTKRLCKPAPATAGEAAAAPPMPIPSTALITVCTIHWTTISAIASTKIAPR